MDGHGIVVYFASMLHLWKKLPRTDEIDFRGKAGWIGTLLQNRFLSQKKTWFSGKLPRKHKKTSYLRYKHFFTEP